MQLVVKSPVNHSNVACMSACHHNFACDSFSWKGGHDSVSSSRILAVLDESGAVLVSRHKHI